MKTILLAAALALAASAPAAAQPQHPHGGPPGLAGKPYGLPPGQAKKLWRKGERLPVEYYRDRRYFLSDYHRYQLAPPPPGHRWVRVGEDVYLVQTRTGVIADLVLSLLR